MDKDERELLNFLENLDKKYGGDIVFLPPISIEEISILENHLQWKLPKIFTFFYNKCSNGIIIDDKRNLSIYDKSQKKTWVENLLRLNTPKLSPYFKERSHIFEDYFIVGTDNSILFCLSKKYSLENPSLYICRNNNSSSGVDFDILNMDLANLIAEMVTQTYN